MAQPALRGKVCLVTGANSGIGKATAVGLARLGATVVMVCRDQARGEKALAEIRASSGNEAVSLMLADLSSQASIRHLASTFLETYQSLHVLVNNAGIAPWRRSVTVDGIEMAFAVNALAPFLLTHLLGASIVDYLVAVSLWTGATWWHSRSPASPRAATWLVFRMAVGVLAVILLAGAAISSQLAALGGTVGTPWGLILLLGGLLLVAVGSPCAVSAFSVIRHRSSRVSALGLQPTEISETPSGDMLADLFCFGSLALFVGLLLLWIGAGIIHLDFLVLLLLYMFAGGDTGHMCLLERKGVLLPSQKGTFLSLLARG